jgi:hypothetical protein
MMNQPIYLFTQKGGNFTQLKGKIRKMEKKIDRKRDEPSLEKIRKTKENKEKKEILE